jgi:hypothetical protein
VSGAVLALRREGASRGGASLVRVASPSAMRSLDAVVVEAVLDLSEVVHPIGPRQRPAVRLLGAELPERAPQEEAGGVARCTPRLLRRAAPSRARREHRGAAAA